MTRAEHYRAADMLIWKVRRMLEEGHAHTAQVLARCALVHATLAACGADVEHQVEEDAKRAAVDVQRAEEGLRAHVMGARSVRYPKDGA